MPVSILAYPMVQLVAPRQKNQTRAAQRTQRTKIVLAALSSVPRRHTIVLHDAGGAADSEN